MVANHQQLRFDLFKRFESYGLALNCNHHLARKLQRLDNWAFEIQKGEVQMVLVSFAYQITTMKILQKGLDPGNFGLVVVHESNLRTRIIMTE
jgi:hypothetical protein